MWTKHLMCAAMLAVAIHEAGAQFQNLEPVPPAGTYSPTLPPGVTFGGPGIPGPVMTVQLPLGPRLTLGASPTFSAPPLTDDGMGRYVASTGIGQASPLRSLWNFNFAVTNVVTGTEYTYGLFWDYNNGTQTINHTGFYFNVVGGSAQDSYNLGMSFIDPFPGNAPDYDPNAAGEFTFYLAAYTYLDTAPIFPLGANLADVDPLDVAPPDQFQVDHVAIRVNADITEVPEPSSLALMILGGVVLAAVGHWRRRSVATR